MSRTARHDPDELRRRAAALLTDGASTRRIATELGIGRDRATTLVRSIEAERTDIAAGHRDALDTLRDNLAQLRAMASDETLDTRSRLQVLREARQTAAALEAALVRAARMPAVTDATATAVAAGGAQLALDPPQPT